MNKRLNCDYLNKNWLSFRLKDSHYIKNKREEYFGEIDENNKFNGKGILITDEDIYIGHFNNGCLAPGKYIYIRHGGVFNVGERYRDDPNGVLKGKSNEYKTDGSKQSYGF